MKNHSNLDEPGFAEHGERPMSGFSSPETSLFVYGTLQPGEPRWRHLEPYVVGDGLADTVAGRLYDTGLGYPAARFAHRDEPVDERIDGAADGLISGRCYRLRAELLAEAWAELDAVEAAVTGAYRRVAIMTTSGRPAQAYEFGLDAAGCEADGVDLVFIETGNWAQWCAQVSR